jgi:pyruvate kinase
MRAIAVFTESGNTARLISKYRPPAPIYAMTPNATVCNALNLLWGVRPVKIEARYSVDQILKVAERELCNLGAAAPGDITAVVTGTQIASGSTNLICLHVVQDTD